MMPKVTVCTVTYNRKKDVLECLNSLYSSNFKDFEVIVFDNHSDKKLDNEELSRFPNLQYIYNDKNIGNAGGRNFCEKIATGKYILFLDDDTVIDENMMEEMVRVMDKDPEVGLLVPKMFFYDKGKTDVLLGGLGQFSRLTTRCFDIASGRRDVGQFESSTSVGCAQNGFMVRKTVSETIGGHDPKIFMTYLETDYCLKVQKLGYKTLYLPEAKLWHKTKLVPRQSNLLRDRLGLPRPERIYYNMRNRSVMVQRHFSWYAKTIYISLLVHLFFLHYFCKFVVYRAPRDYFRNLFRGYFEGLLIVLGVKQL